MTTKTALKTHGTNTPWKTARTRGLALTGRRGFTLIEMCVVLLIGGVIVVAASELYRQYLRNNYITVTNNRIAAVHKAIQEYVDDSVRNPYHLLPCPADPTLAPNSLNYGRAIRSTARPGYPCPAAGGYGGSTGGPASTFAGTTRTSVPTANLVWPGTPGTEPPSWGAVRYGAVPVRDLGLSNEYMTEPNGFLFIYAVSEAVANLPPQPGTVGCAASPTTCFVGTPPGTPTVAEPYPISAPDMSWGAIDVQTPGGISLTEPPASVLYVVISPGRDGRGAMSSNGVASGLAALGYDAENRDNDPIFISAPYSD